MAMELLQASRPVHRIFSGASSGSAPRAVRFATTPQACAAPAQNAVDRRLAIGLLVAAPLLGAPAARSKDVRDALRAKEARLEALKKASEKTRKTGQPEQAFSDSTYAVSEDKSPNIHTRQEEGVRTSKS